MINLLVYIRDMVTDHNLQWFKPAKSAKGFVEFENNGKTINFELYDDGHIDCYYQESKYSWKFTNDPKQFADMWERFQS